MFGVTWKKWQLHETVDTKAAKKLSWILILFIQNEAKLRFFAFSNKLFK